MTSLKKLSDDLAEWVGHSFRISIESAGALATFFFSSIREIWRVNLIIEQMYMLGNKSLSFIALSSTFVGFITTITYTNLTDRLFVAPSIMGRMVSRVVFMELGPALVGLILAGKIGAKIASEIASMRMTEQIDALTCLSLSPKSYLITPRIVACFFMGPVFFVVSSLIAIISSQFFASLTCGVGFFAFYNGMRGSFDLIIIMMGLVKVTVFSTTNAVIGCYFGFTAFGGATGVGKATRNTVIASSLFILLENILLTKVLI
jgi:phospholipid/cholesterol/gamma-HCH transport system permease protein